MSQQILVSDTNVWIDLHRGGLLIEAFKLPFSFITTDFVRAELNQPDGKDLEQLGLQVVPLNDKDIKALDKLTISLRNSSLADVSCFYLAQREEITLLTNDKAIRKAAMNATISVHGTLWLLDQLFEAFPETANQISRALEMMLSQGARFPEAECRKRIQRWSIK
ncbi:MAG: type II toxin-antitoxin system VapC family toxin [Pseudomonadales bacterium]|nr:type II toxin-antitoxin system VapC family toxin [Pseudomonadales bacterium]